VWHILAYAIPIIIIFGQHVLGVSMAKALMNSDAVVRTHNAFRRPRKALP